jgi:uncharacterized integral membrane protein
MVEEEKLIEKIVEEKTQSKDKLFKIIGSIISIVVLIVLIVIKTQKPEFPLFVFVGGIIFIIVFFFAMFFGFTLYRKYQEAMSKKDAESKLPPAITLEQADELIKKLLINPNYSDYAVGWLQHKVYTVGEHTKSRVLLVHLSPTPYSIEPFQFIIMNLHYPKELWDYICQTKFNPGELMRAVNSAGIDPKEDPDVEKRIERDLSTGKEVEYTKRSKHDKIEKSEKKADLE